MPAITLDLSVDNEYTLTAIDRNNGNIIAAAMSYDCSDATLKIDLQLIELGFDVYAIETI